MTNLNEEQQDQICFLIGDWYINVKDNLVNYADKTHTLGFTKEILKEMLCTNLTFDEVMHGIAVKTYYEIMGKKEKTKHE
jgi:hypothetical protein